MAAKVREGGCLCGALRYRCTGEPIDVGYCHCRICQRSSGAPVVVWAVVRRSDFAWTAGDPSAFRSSAHAARLFCPRCGSPVAYQEDGEPDRIELNVAGFDDPAGLPPERHIWTASRIPWFETEDDLPRHREGHP